jgi:hypothetical protein
MDSYPQSPTNIPRRRHPFPNETMPMMSEKYVMREPKASTCTLHRLSVSHR